MAPSAPPQLAHERAPQNVLVTVNHDSARKLAFDEWFVCKWGWGRARPHGVFKEGGGGGGARRLVAGRRDVDSSESNRIARSKMGSLGT